MDQIWVHSCLPEGRVGRYVCGMCSCLRFSMARVLGQLWAGMGPLGGQEILLWPLSPGESWCQNGSATLEQT